MKHVVCGLIGLVLLAGRADAANIIWYSFSAIEADSGFVDLLETAGHNVTRVQEENPLTSPTISTLNAADLVITSRSVNSGSFDGATNPVNWNEVITTPMMALSAYIIRNNRLGWFTGDTLPDLLAESPLVAADPSHPVFDGIAFGSDGVTTAGNYNVVIDRGISTPDTAPKPGGTVIATSPMITNGVAIAEWAAGSTFTDEAGLTTTLAAPRYFFAGGSREAGGTGMGVDTAGKLDLTTLGQQLFLNTVNYALGTDAPVAGDFNGDGAVNSADYTILVNNLGGHLDGPVGRAEGDMNFDQRIDLTDFGLFKDAFPGALGQGQAIPEPTSVTLLLLVGGAAALAARRRGARLRRVA